MPTTTQPTSLAFDRRGAGVPIVLLAGLTFERRTWRPIIERLGHDVCSLAVDLPGHGDSAGSPYDMTDAAARFHHLVETLGIEAPVVVGHSMSGGVAMTYAASYPARGAVTVDSQANLVPFAELLQRLEPALRGPGSPRRSSRSSRAWASTASPSRCDPSCSRRRRSARTSSWATGTS
jgi:pimeloyl-ACP methyl ester carboxylesterase